MKMSKTRLYVEKELSLNVMIYIKNKQHHFLKNVLRIKIQDHILIFDGITGEWLSKVVSINRDNIVLQVINKIREIKSETDIWLIFAPIKLFRMNITIQKATELGITRFVPCITKNTNQSKINIRNLKMNIIEATEQSERLLIPSIDEPIEMDKIVEKFPKDRCLIFCNENHEKLPMIYNALLKQVDYYKKWAVLIGPEGGFSKEEEEMILSLPSTISVSLGERILRSDTATTAAIFSLQSLVEDNK
tara:strand:- start:329 stop:1069 length:741 start_codon:yes stop_codon:yes gene_type:complete